MKDTIERQSAIDVVSKWFEKIELNGDICVDGLRQLPSAELGTNLAEVSTDCISRQAAIDICANAIDLWHGQIGEGALVAVRDKIAELTPAEPKRGKWIKTARWGRVYYCNQCRNYLDFDGVNAGRGSANFCPNCGAKMEGTT